MNVNRNLGTTCLVPAVKQDGHQEPCELCVGSFWYGGMYLIVDFDVVTLPFCFIEDDLVLTAYGVIFDIQDVRQGRVVQDDPRGEVLWGNGRESAISPRGDQSKGMWGCRSGIPSSTGDRSRKHPRLGSQLPRVVQERYWRGGNILLAMGRGTQHVLSSKPCPNCSLT